MPALNSRFADLPLLPALFMAALCLGGAIHQNPNLLRPALSLAHALPHLL